MTHNLLQIHFLLISDKFVEKLAEDARKAADDEADRKIQVAVSAASKDMFVVSFRLRWFLLAFLIMYDLYRQEK